MARPGAAVVLSIDRVAAAILAAVARGILLPAGVWTFSPRLAERDNDGSRGLSICLASSLRERTERRL